MVKAGTELLEVPEERMNWTLDAMLSAHDLIMDIDSHIMTTDAAIPLNLFENQEKHMIYLPVFYYSEVGTANRLVRIMNADRRQRINMFGIDGYAGGIHYDETH